VPCDDSETASSEPSGDGTYQSIVVAPDASMRFGSTTIRSPARSSRLDKATSCGCCSGGLVFSAKYAEPPRMSAA
jgi:hypothetical protein